MPTYTYQCKGCDDVVEKFQKITEEPLTTCDKCGGEYFKVIQPVRFKLTGKGFHATDYPNWKIKDKGD
jgi:putative FmdB family regulatory protein